MSAVRLGRHIQIAGSGETISMIKLETYTLNELFRKSLHAHADQLFGGFVNEEHITYREWGRQTLQFRTYIQNMQLPAGSKIALLSENSPQWSMVYFGIVLAGHTAVPILPDFNAKEIWNILEHSDSAVIFVSKRQKAKIEKEQKQEQKSDVRILEILETAEQFVQDDEAQKLPEDAVLPAEEEDAFDADDLASIIYTSGTTGQSKGVMLTHRNLCTNAEISASSFISIEPGDRMLSVLPMSHAYEFTIGLLLGLVTGIHFHYLRKPPSASVLLPALKAVKPHIMLSVPLLIEKMYRASILPKIRKKRLLRMLYKAAPFRRMINRKIGRQLMTIFGGEIRFFGVGGAPLDPEVELFLQEAKFPYAIGYGLTETAPLIAGCAPDWTKLASTGKPLSNVSMRISDEGREDGTGEIQVTGPNIMKGYYKNPEATNEVFTEDGWFCTGDLGYMDEKGFLFIKGRKKNMILGPSGENIYPEMIENILNTYDFVEESLVVHSQEGLLARININVEAFAESLKVSADHAGEHVKEYLDSIRKKANKELNVFSKIQNVIHQKEPFIRTPTKKIKRYLYDLMHKK